MGAEEIQDSNRGFASLWKRRKSEKIDDYDTLVNLTIDKVSENSVVELLYQTPVDTLFDSSITGLRKGDSVVLYPTPDPEELNPLRSQILKGTLSEILPDRVIVSLISKQVEAQYFKSCKLWAVERDFRDSGYRDMLLSLYQYIKSSPEYKGLIFGKIAPGFEKLDFVENPELNENQNAIIQQALNARDYFLIQGPPGTGKTSTVLRDIIRRLNQQGEQVMVLAFTNRAVDEICKMLEKIEGLNFIRLGRGSTEPYCWQTLANNLNLGDLHSRLISARVIVSTQSTFTTSLDILQVKKFDTLVVDEASQLLEPQLVGYLSNFKRFILIGDENQLPAVVLQDQLSSKTQKAELHAIEITDLRESLFSRLLANAQKHRWACFGMLTQHFRMHEDVAGFVNRAFYNNQLVVGLDRQKAGIVEFDPSSDNPIERKLAVNRVVFIPSKKEQRTKINEFESDIARQVVELLRRKWKHNFDLDRTIGVIVPFRAQMAMIKKMLPKDIHGLSVDTVERYQGSERDVIVLSFAVRNAAQLQSVESIAQNGVDRKLNVALSRARDFIIITGCEDVLRKSRHIAALLDDIHSKGGYLEMPYGATVIAATSIDTSDLF
jgi:DNA replication ATP-dependent helicase Dna2